MWSAQGLCGGDRRLAAGEEPPLGAHLITPRFGYAHHGIYVGSETVVHYAAFAYHWHRGPVEEVSFSRFAHGHPVLIRPAGSNAVRFEEIIRRARSRLGENRYRLLSNNCEHFAEWCVYGEHRSHQAERLLAPLRYLRGALSEPMRWMKVARQHPEARLNVDARIGMLTKAAASMIFLVIALTRTGTGIAAPMADVGSASLPRPHATATGSFNLRDGARYNLGRRVGLFVDYKEMKPACGALSPLETGPRAMPPVRLGGFLVSAGIRVYLN